MAAPLELRTKLIDLVADVHPEIVEAGTRARNLASHFLRDGVVPKSKPFDALHVAVAFAERVAVLASWNFKHIANVRRSQRFNATALAFGINHRVEIVSLPELLHESEA